jgi:hypothetical protein
MPFLRIICAFYMDQEIISVAGGILGDVEWKQKLAVIFVDSESIGYSKWQMYQDIKIYMRTSAVIPIESQDRILLKLLRQMPDVA